MRLNNTILFLPLLISTFLSLTDSNRDWVMKKNENGIAVYTSIKESHKIKEVKIIDTVRSSLSGIVALLNDTKNYPTWVYRCGGAKVLKSITDKEQYNYELTILPWPFDNREVITYSKVSQDSLTKIVTIESSAAPGYMPCNDNIVRIKQFHSVYTLTKLTNGLVKIDYELYADPGGDIPTWLINANIIIGPYNSTAAMNKQIPNYQLTTYSFIKE